MCYQRGHNSTDKPVTQLLTQFRGFVWLAFDPERKQLRFNLGCLFGWFYLGPGYPTTTYFLKPTIFGKRSRKYPRLQNAGIAWKRCSTSARPCVAPRVYTKKKKKTKKEEGEKMICTITFYYIFQKKKTVRRQKAPLCNLTHWAFKQQFTFPANIFHFC